MHGRKDRMGHGPDIWASVSPKAQILASLAVLVPVALSGLALVALAPPFWWLFTTYFWVSFPALGLLVRGLGGSQVTPLDLPRDGARSVRSWRRCASTAT